MTMDISGKPPTHPKSTQKNAPPVAQTVDSSKHASSSKAKIESPSLKDLGLKQGQDYLATVLNVAVDAKLEAKQAAIRQILIKVDNRQLAVMTNIPLEEGELIKVTVAEDFKLTLSRSTTPSPAISMERLAALMAKILPYQASVNTGLSAALTADKIAADSLNTNIGLTKEQTAALSALVKLLPKSDLISKGLTSLSHIIEQTKPTQSITNTLQQILSPPKDTANQAGDQQRQSQTTTTLRDIMQMTGSQLKQQLATLSAAKDMPPLIKTAFTQLSRLSTAEFTQKLFQLPLSKSVTEKSSAQISQTMAGKVDMGILDKPITQSLAQKLIQSESIGVVIKQLQQALLSGGEANTIPKPAAMISSTVASKTLGSTTPTSSAAPGTHTTPQTNEVKTIRTFLQTEVVKTHLNFSGLALENLLANQSNTLTPRDIVQGDLKSALIKLTTALAPEYLKENGLISHQGKLPTAISPEIIQAPFNYPKTNLPPPQTAQMSQSTELTAGELLRQIAATLNRIQFNQLNSLYQSQAASSDTTGVQTWMIDLPFVVNSNETELVQVKIEKFNSQDNKAKQKEKNSLTQQWKITLGFDFENLGAMQIQVRWYDQKISSTLWADRSDTLHLLNKETAYFRQQLKDLGYEVDTIECRHGKLPTKQEVISQNLVDVRT